MRSNKPICKDKLIIGLHCSLCPAEDKCKNWKKAFKENEDKNTARLSKWCEKEYSAIVVG